MCLSIDGKDLVERVEETKKRDQVCAFTEKVEKI